MGLTDGHHADNWANGRELHRSMSFVSDYSHDKERTIISDERRTTPNVLTDLGRVECSLPKSQMLNQLNTIYYGNHF